MPYVGRTPTPSPVTIDDIPANSIDASKIVDGSIEVSDIKDNSITDAKLNSTKLDGIETGATNYIHPTTHATADIADNAITDAKLNSTKLDGIADSANNYSHPAAHTVSEVTGLQGLLDGKTTETYVNTQVAALVASSPATLDTLNELATALGNDPSFATTVTNSIGTKLPLAGGTMTGDVSLGDNVKAKFGASDDLQIYHDSGNSVIQDNGVGDLYIMGESSIRLTNNNAVNHYAKFNNGGSVQLYHNNLSKLATTSTGVDVTGNVACDSLGVTGSTGSISLGGSGNNIDIGSGTGTQSAILNIGAGRTASGYAYIDLIGDTTYTDYGLRVMRENAGANAGSQISHRGTGSLALAATDGGNLIFNSAGEKMRINSAGNVGIGTTAPSVMLDIGASGKPGEIRVTNNVYDSWILQKRRSDNTQICGIKESGSGGLSFLANGERVRITSAGNVGIGTNPDTYSLLHLKRTTADCKLTIETDESHDAYINFSGSTSEMSLGYEPTTNSFIIANAADGLTSAERMRIDSVGDAHFTGTVKVANIISDNFSPQKWYTTEITVVGDSNYFYPIGIGIIGKTDIRNAGLTNVRLYRNYNWPGPYQNEPSSWSGSSSHQGGLIAHLNFWEVSWSDMYDRQVWQYRRSYHTIFDGTWALPSANQPNSHSGGVFVRGGFKIRVDTTYDATVEQVTEGALAYSSGSYNFYNPNKKAYASRDTKWDSNVYGGV